MTKTLMERNRERIARVRAENLQKKQPKVKNPKRRDRFTVGGTHETLTWDDSDARRGIVVTVRPHREGVP